MWLVTCSRECIFGHQVLIVSGYDDQLLLAYGRTSLPAISTYLFSVDDLMMVCVDHGLTKNNINMLNLSAPSNAVADLKLLTLAHFPHLGEPPTPVAFAALRNLLENQVVLKMMLKPLPS